MKAPGYTRSKDEGRLQLEKDAVSGGDGQRIALNAPEPHPDPVTLAEVLEEIEAVVSRHVVVADGASVAIALWIAHTYFFDAATVAPRLAILSPTKRCGKTLLLSLLLQLVLKPISASNLTGPVVFRVIAAFRPTLLVDEADCFLWSKHNDELRGILNSGHTRTFAVVPRCSGDERVPKLYSTWAPLAIAAIGKLPSTLADRSIVVSMRRKTRDDRVERLRIDRDPYATLRSKIARAAQDYVAAVGNSDPEVPGELDDRAQDNWTPLLQIADAAGGTWPQRAREAAVELSRDRAEEDESKGEVLLADLREIFREKQTDRITTEDIRTALEALEERPWPTYGKGKPITARQIANLLRPFGIASKNIRIGVTIAKGYASEDLEEAWNRYLPTDPRFLSATPLHRSNDKDLEQNLSATSASDSSG